MKNLTLLIHFKKITLPLLLLLFSYNANALELVDRIVAVVNEDVVMLSELRREAQELHAQLKRSNPQKMPSRNRILSEALDKLIIHKLQLAEAKRLGMRVDQETVTRAMMSIAQNNNLSLIRFRDALAEEGISYAHFQNHIEETLLIRRLINQEVNNKIQISKAEVNQELNRQHKKQPSGSVRLQHILLHTPENANQTQIKQARDKALRARAQIDNGKAFQAVAQTVSDSRDGGNLGWIPMQKLPMSFNENLRNAKVDDVIGPFRSSRGYHIVKILGFRGQKQSSSSNLVQQTLVRHILIRTDELTSDNDAKNRLIQLRDRIINGEDFASLARSHSSDQASAIKGGELGWVDPEDMVPVFAQRMGDTPVKTISEPFKSRFGWHILEVLERRNYDQSEDVQRLAARKALQERKAKEAKTQYLRKLRSTAYIDIRASS